MQLAMLSQKCDIHVHQPHICADSIVARGENQQTLLIFPPSTQLTQQIAAGRASL